MPAPPRTLTNDYKDCRLIKLDASEPKSPLIVTQHTASSSPATAPQNASDDPFSTMKSTTHLITAVAILGLTILLPACSTSGVKDARQSGVERRQDRIDSRTSARQNRWSERAEREDARAAARFDSW